MKCPKCGSDTTVYEKRWAPIMYQITGYNMRRRECRKCKFRFTTEEIYIRPVTDRNNRKIKE